MIPVHKLSRLPASQRRRKLALVLAGLERVFSAQIPHRGEVRARGDLSVLGADSGAEGADAAAIVTSADAPIPEREYLLSIVSLALEDPKIEDAARAELMRLRDDARAEAGIGPLYRLCNAARHSLLSAAGSLPAEWDLIVPGSGSDRASRPFFPGVAVYAEDLRSPFNLGSVFRTAEAFGAERVFVSPLCVPPDHPRAIRSAMGCVDWLPWERRSLSELPEDVPVFALETGGTPIDEFDFPDRGIVIVGSEELGISPEGLARASYGRVSIPMTGIKASINVGVAFGILMQAWTAYLRCSASNPD